MDNTLKKEIKELGSRCGKGLSKSFYTELLIKYLKDKGLKIQIVSNKSIKL